MNARLKNQRFYKICVFKKAKQTRVELHDEKKRFFARFKIRAHVQNIHKKTRLKSLVEVLKTPPLKESHGAKVVEGFENWPELFGQCFIPNYVVIQNEGNRSARNFI